MNARRDFTGERFGMLVVKQFLETRKGKRIWRCLCDCGNTKDVAGSNLATGNTKACGCQRDGHPKHGMANKVPEYSVWKGMWRRCEDENHKDFQAYKGRKPPDSWRDFKVFMDYMGPRPSKTHSLERVDNSRGYGPGNTVWATRVEQNNNKSNSVYLTHNGVTKTCPEWARELSVSPTTIMNRFKAGTWPATRVTYKFRVDDDIKSETGNCNQQDSGACPR